MSSDAQGTLDNAVLRDIFANDTWLGNDTSCVQRFLLLADGRIGAKDCVPISVGAAGCSCPNASYVVHNICTDSGGRVVNISCILLTELTSNATLTGSTINSNTGTVTGVYGVTVDLAMRGAGPGLQPLLSLPHRS